MSDLTWIEIIYWAATIIGGTLFLLRTIMMLIGGGFGHDDFDTHIDGDFGFDHDHHMDVNHVDSIADSDFSFKLLSLQGLTAFFVMFGLVGLALLRANLAIIITIIGGSFAGLFAVWFISLLFFQMKRLQSDGTVKIRNAIGQSGSVYLVIPSQGSGQVQVVVQGGLKVFDAISAQKEKILTGEKVRVTGIIDNNTLVVEKI